jgi:hypothetical protein
MRAAGELFCKQANRSFWKATLFPNKAPQYLGSTLMIRAMLLLAELLLAVAFLFMNFALGKLRKFMAENVGIGQSVKDPWKIYRQYKLMHPESMLNKCYSFLNISMVLLGAGFGAVAFCFGKLMGQ